MLYSVATPATCTLETVTYAHAIPLHVDVGGLGAMVSKEVERERRRSKSSTFKSILFKTTAAQNIHFIYLLFKETWKRSSSMSSFIHGQDREFPTNSEWLPGMELMGSVVGRISNASILFVPPVVDLRSSWLPKYDTRVPPIFSVARMWCISLGK